MVFRKAKMLARLEQAGMLHLIDEECEKIMDALDGKEAVKNDFKALIYDEEEYYITVDGKSYPVNKLDCE